MDLSIFQQYRSDIAAATRFSQLVDLDNSLSSLPPGRLPQAAVDYLKEELELRGGSTVYTALTRLHLRAQALGLAPIFPQDAPELDIDMPEDVLSRIVDKDEAASSALDDDDEIEKMVESMTGAAAGAPYDEASRNKTMAALLEQPGFLEEIDIAEKEEGGVFDLTGPLAPAAGSPAVVAVLRDLANCATTSAVGSVVRALQDSSLFEDLPGSVRDLVTERINERLAITSGAEGNASMVDLRRRARSMGMTLDEWFSLEREAVRKDAPLFFRSFLETLRDEKQNIVDLVGDDDDPSPEAIQKLQDVIQDKMNQRLQDKRAAEALIGEISRQRPPDPSR